ncbi:hypothetical protein [Oceanicola sp. S124]|uniref:hypothetical protein n=1 Tax=Oceanicola sp. S124 TaxID=1042378 RepID=UPI00187294FE|nr:hypothetical protein [Oceanicola sp. S124]
MSPPNRPIFLERHGYRQRRLLDAARLLPVLGLILLAVPMLWPQGDAGGMASAEDPTGGGLPTSRAIIYIFVTWGALAALSSLLVRALPAAAIERLDAGMPPLPPGAAPPETDPPEKDPPEKDPPDVDLPKEREELTGWAATPSTGAGAETLAEMAVDPGAGATSDPLGGRRPGAADGPSQQPARQDGSDPRAGHGLTDRTERQGGPDGQDGREGGG